MSNNTIDDGTVDKRRWFRFGGLEDLAFMECPLFAIQRPIGQQDQRSGEEIWETVEGLWFTIAEAKEFAESIKYRLPEYRIHAIGCRGDLEALLKAHTEES